MKLNFARNIDESKLSKLNPNEPNGFGYENQQDYLIHSLNNNGVIFDDTSDVALHLRPLTYYRKIENKFNVAYTMYEFETIPPWWLDKFKDIDLFIVPSNHNKRLFRRYTTKPIEVCQEGVDVNQYPFYQRHFPTNKKFRFLYVGASNLRKGIGNLFSAWEQFNLKMPKLSEHCELYIKTSTKGNDVKEQNVILDNKIKTRDELRDIYNSAHCFILPSMGEGWGLTLVEALSTGSPCIYTNYSAMVDYMNNDIGYPLDYALSDVRTAERINKYSLEFTGFLTEGAFARNQHILDNIFDVLTNYDEALEKGKRGSQVMKDKYTWDQSAKRLIEIINKYRRK